MFDDSRANNKKKKGEVPHTRKCLHIFDFSNIFSLNPFSSKK